MFLRILAKIVALLPSSKAIIILEIFRYFLIVNSLDGKSNSGSENISHSRIHVSGSDLGSKGGSAGLVSWCFMVRI